MCVSPKPLRTHWKPLNSRRELHLTAFWQFCVNSSSYLPDSFLGIHMLCLYSRSIQKISSHIIWKTETFIEGDTRYKQHCTKGNDTSIPFNVGTLGPYTVLPIAISCPIVFSWISSTVWNLFPLKGDFSFGKSQKSQGAKSGVQGGWVTWPIWHFTKNTTWDVMHEWVHCCDEAASHQLPIAVAFWTVQVVSVEEYSSSTQNLRQIHCSTHSVILNVMATKYTFSLKGVCCPHWLVSEVVIVHTCAFRYTLLGCQVTSMLPKPFSLY